MKKELAPLIVAVALLLPTLYVASYVASYVALVVPSGVPYGHFYCNGNRGIISSSYRVGKEWPERFYWPLEQFDRKLRFAAWPDERLGINFDE